MLFKKRDEKEFNQEHFNSLYQPEYKVQYFFAWCMKNGRYEKIIENLVSKFSIWYELRYPDNYLDNVDTSDVMLKGLDLEEKKLLWCDFYTFDKFLYSLSNDERNILKPPKYPSMIYFDRGGHLHMDSDDGVISDFPYCVLNDRDGNSVSVHKILEGKKVSEYRKIFDEYKLDFKIDRLDAINDEHNKATLLQNIFFDSVMYRLIERGGKYYGSRRAVLFAQEFGCSVEEAVRYGDSSLMIEYIENGGNEDLMCYVDYFKNGTNEQKSIREVLNNLNFVDSLEKPKIKVFK